MDGTTNYVAMNDEAPKFDRVTGAPLNDAALKLRKQHEQQGLIPASNTTNSPGTTLNVALPPPEPAATQVPIHGQDHFEQNAIAKDIELVVNYDAAGRADISSGQITMRVMLVGDPGVGKSSYINTARAVFNNEVYQEDAGVGEGQSTVTELAESYALLREKKDHLRFTDTRGWVGVTEEVCENIERMLAGSLDSGNRSMMNYEREGVDKKTWYMTEATRHFLGVYGTHHACIYFIDASVVIISEAKFSEMVENIIECFSALKEQGGFEPAFFVTKVDKIRLQNPNWE